MTNICIECPICFDILDNTRMIGCGHSFCTKCIYKLFKLNKIISCPLCLYKIKLNSINDLPRNYSLDNIINIIKMNKLIYNNIDDNHIDEDINNDKNNDKNRLSNCQRMCYGCCISHLHRDNDK